MSGLEVAPEALLLLARLGLLAILYLFLVLVFLVVRGELRRRATPPAPGRLIVLEPGATRLPRGQALPLQPVTVIGRAPGCQLVLNDTFVSTAHAVLTWRDGQWWLRDAGSTNGTRLNHQPVLLEETAVAFGDVLDLGAIRMKLAP